MSTFSIFSNVFGFIVAAISLSAFLINICRSRLPSNRIKELEDLMDQTETFFTEAREEGVLTEPTFVWQTERHLSMLRIMTRRLQTRAYNATTLRQDYLEFLKGTSTSIGGTCESLRKLRAQVITSSEEGRCRVMEDAQALTPYTTTRNFNAAPDSQRSALPTVRIPRPGSCPPALRKWEVPHAQRAFPQTQPLTMLNRASGIPLIETSPVPMRSDSDSDVRTADTQTCVSTIHTSVTVELRA